MGYLVLHVRNSVDHARTPPAGSPRLHREIRVETTNCRIGRIHGVGVDVLEEPDLGMMQIRGLLHG